MERKICAVYGCNNFAALKQRIKGKKYYRKWCGSHRSKEKKQRKLNRIDHATAYRELICSMFDNKCCICKDTFTFRELDIHHKIPIRLGGENKQGNINVICRKCHIDLHAKELTKA